MRCTKINNNGKLIAKFTCNHLNFWIVKKIYVLVVIIYRNYLTKTYKSLILFKCIIILVWILMVFKLIKYV